MPPTSIVILIVLLIFIVIFFAFFKLDWLKTKISFFKLIDFEFEGKTKTNLVDSKKSSKKQKKLENNNLRITNPPETYIEHEMTYVPVSGTGGIANRIIILISSLDGKYLAPQDGKGSIEQNGNWEHPGIYLKHEDRKRFIYALSLSKEDEPVVKNFLKQKEEKGFHSENAIDHLLDFLKANKIVYQISQEKLLIRKKTDQISRDNSRDVIDHKLKLHKPETSPPKFLVKDVSGGAQKNVNAYWNIKIDNPDYTFEILEIQPVGHFLVKFKPDRFIQKNVPADLRIDGLKDLESEKIDFKIKIKTEDNFEIYAIYSFYPQQRYISGKLIDNYRNDSTIRRILWVDDKPHNNVHKVAQAVKEMNMEVDFVFNSDLALQNLDQEKKYDLLISDLKRQGNPRAGLDLLQKLNKTIPVLIFAGKNGVTNYLEEAISLGAKDVILASEPEKLLNAIKKLLLSKD